MTTTITKPSNCPKCGSKRVWLTLEHPDVVLQCTCGIRKILYTVLKPVEPEPNKKPLQLPTVNTRLWITLQALHNIGVACTAEIHSYLEAKEVPYTLQDVSGYLSDLKARNLIDVVEFSRGNKNGATWQVAKKTKELLY